MDEQIREDDFENHVSHSSIDLMSKNMTGAMTENEKQSRRYNHLFQSVLCGIVQYQFTPEGHIAFKDANREAIRIFGYTPDEFWAKERWNLATFITEGDRDRVLTAVQGMKTVGDKNSYQYRLLQKNGKDCWIIGSEEIIQDIDGAVIIQSVFLDIDSQRRIAMHNDLLSQQVKAGNQLLKMALENTSTCEFYYYPQNHIMGVPKRTCEYYGCEEQYENMPYSFADKFVDSYFHSAFCEMYHRIDSGESTASVEFKSNVMDVWCHVTISTVSYTQANEPTFAVGIVEDITKQKEMELALQEEKSRDRLTNFYTREAGTALVREYMYTKDHSQVCAIMLLDMDDFGKLNAEEGNVFADMVLQDVARILQDETRLEDIRIRLGGDEFMLFVKDCDKERATIIGRCITQKVKALYKTGDQDFGLSCSIGMCVTSVVDVYEGLYRCAESALLYVKEHEKGKAACYLDTSNEVGVALTEIYTNEHMFNKIESHAKYEEDDIMKYALELLGNAKRLCDAIFLLLARIGIKYGLDRVSIVEVNQEYLSYRYTYQWARNKSDYQMGHDYYINNEEYKAILSMYDENGICEDIYDMEPRFHSCLQAAIWGHGNYAGAMRFEYREAGIVWSEGQKKFIQEITKLIASFIMQARSDAISKAKTDFLSRMSHEIRTPMNAISGMTTIAKAALDDKEKALDCLNKIESANGFLLSLINDILDMSRIESGKIELNHAFVDLRLFLRELEMLMAAQADEKHLQLSFVNHCASNRPVMADCLRLNQILINIIGNAVKFTPASGSIAVTVEPVKETNETVLLRFSVRDTGIGISKEAMRRIFNVFEQENKNTSAQYGGTGLGLAISSSLVQMMSGVLEVESEVGQGTDFHFTIPFEYAEEGVLSQMEDREIQGSVNVAKGKRILLVDDNELNREIASELLEMSDFIVETAADGKEAVTTFGHRGVGYYDVILMDIRMPVMDGLEATRKIRTLGQADSRTIPIIAMTANAFDEDTRQSMESGMNSHLTKPIELERLLSVIQQCMVQ